MGPERDRRCPAGVLTNVVVRVASGREGGSHGMEGAFRGGVAG